MKLFQYLKRLERGFSRNVLKWPKTSLFHDTKPPVTKPLMTENGKHAKTGGGLYGVLGVGQCFWPIGRGGVLLRLPEF